MQASTCRASRCVRCQARQRERACGEWRPRSQHASQAAASLAVMTAATSSIRDWAAANHSARGRGSSATKPVGLAVGFMRSAYVTGRLGNADVDDGMRCHSPHVQSLCLASSWIHPRPSHGMVMGARAVATSSSCSPDRGRLTSLGHPPIAHRGRSDYSSPNLLPSRRLPRPVGTAFTMNLGYRRMLGLACATAQSSCNDVHAQIARPPLLAHICCEL